MTVDDMTEKNPETEQHVDPETAHDPELPETAEPEELQSDIEALQAELSQAHDRALRAQAELDNYRKRMNRELQDAVRYAAVNVIRDLLPVVDNMQRALEAAQAAGESGSLLQGVQMVSQQMADVLAQHGLKPIAAEGQAFDADLHEAVSQQPTTDAEPGTVLHVVQVGYQLQDRVVRPAKVIVAQAPAG